MKIELSEHFTYKKLLRFTAPSVAMMIFTSIYGVVDGYFVSNYVGKTPFAAINLIMPFLIALGTVGFMIGTGGSALVAKTLGEGKSQRAKGLFTMLVAFTAVFGVISSGVAIAFLRPVSQFLGATGEILDSCMKYGRIILAFNTMFMLQNAFQSFLVVAEKPKFGFYVTVAAGVTNMTLDWLFVAVMGLGIKGAAFATGISQTVGALLPLGVFVFSKSGKLAFTKPVLELRALGKVCVNGSSEMMTNLSMSVVNMLYNFKLMSIAGEDGVAAYGAIMYISFIFISAFIGYSIGSAPIVSFHYGAGNKSELHNILVKSITVLAVAGVCVTVTAELLALPLARLYVGYDAALTSLTADGMRMLSLAFLIQGINIYGSSFFTALNNGGVSALLSFTRTLLFQCVSVLLLPMLLGINGVWLASVAAETVAIALTVFFILKMRKQYGY